MRIIILLIISYVFGADNAVAAIVSDTSDVLADLPTVKYNLANAIERVLASNVAGLATLLFIFFSFIKITQYARHYVLGDVVFIDVAEGVFLIMFVKVLMLNFNELSSMIYSTFDSMGAVIQQAVVGDDDVMYLLEYLDVIVGSISLGSIDIFDSIGRIISYAFLYIVIGALNIFIFMMSVWSIYGYTFAKMVGLIFLPFLVLPSTRSYFMGWLRFFLSFCVLIMVLRVNASIILILLTSLFGYDPTTIPNGQLDFVQVDDIGSISGMMGILAVSVLAMWKTVSITNNLIGSGMDDITGMYKSALKNVGVRS